MLTIHSFERKIKKKIRLTILTTIKLVVTIFIIGQTIIAVLLHDSVTDKNGANVIYFTHNLKKSHGCECKICLSLHGCSQLLYIYEIALLGKNCRSVRGRSTKSGCRAQSHTYFKYEEKCYTPG